MPEKFDAVRFRYLLNCGRSFLPTRDQWEEVIRQGNAAADEVERLRGCFQKHALRHSRRSTAILSSKK